MPEERTRAGPRGGQLTPKETGRLADGASDTVACPRVPAAPGSCRPHLGSAALPLIKNINF